MLVILFFLALSFGLLHLLPAALRAPEGRDQPFTILRVWNAEEEPAVQSWLRGQAKAYERATGQRVYLRAASLASADQDLLPDALISQSGDRLLALRGYALILRADTAAVTFNLHTCGSITPLRVELVKAGGQWQIDNFYDRENDLDLKAAMQDYLKKK